MTQMESHSEEKAPHFGLFPVAMGAKQFEEFANAQRTLVSALLDSQRQWLNSFQSKTQLASEYAAKLSATRSAPDAMAVCQEWANHRIEIMAEDGKLLAADTQKLMESGAKLFSRGPFVTEGNGGATK